MWDAASAWSDEQYHVRAQDSNQRNTAPPAAEHANLTTRPRGQPPKPYSFLNIYLVANILLFIHLCISFLFTYSIFFHSGNFWRRNWWIKMFSKFKGCWHIWSSCLKNNLYECICSATACEHSSSIIISSSSSSSSSITPQLTFIEFLTFAWQSSKHFIHSNSFNCHNFSVVDTMVLQNVWNGNWLHMIIFKNQKYESGKS